MSDDNKIDLISKDLEYVKDTVQNVDRRVSNIETHMQKFVEDFTEHLATDRQMGSNINRLTDILDRNTDSLQEHMRRTDLAETNIKYLAESSKDIESRVKPLEISYLEREAQTKLWVRVGIIFGALASIVSVAYTVGHITGLLP